MYRSHIMVKVKQDLTGWRMSEHGVPDSRLTVIKQVEDYVAKNGKHHPRWLCQCDCGQTVVCNSYHIKSGNTKSCGCKLTEVLKERTEGNKWEILDEYIIGYTSRGVEFYIDKEDYGRVSEYNWWADKNGYIIGYIEGRSRGLHRFIMSPPADKVVDHINHNPSDNRKSNLRICSQKDNTRNQSLDKRNTTNYTGVYKNPHNGKWMAKIGCNYRLINLGTFDTIEEAIQVRKEAEKKYGFISQE